MGWRNINMRTKGLICEYTGNFLGGEYDKDREIISTMQRRKLESLGPSMSGEKH